MTDELRAYTDGALELLYVPGHITIKGVMLQLEHRGLRFSRRHVLRLLHAAEVPLFRIGHSYLVEDTTVGPLLTVLQARQNARDRGERAA